MAELQDGTVFKYFKNIHQFQTKMIKFGKF